MATLEKLLSNSLTALKKVQDMSHSKIIQTKDLSVIHLKRLVENHFLEPIIKGWYMISNPLDGVGDTTMWYTSYWQFIAKYADFRYENDWCLSPEQSLALYTGSTIIPQQLVIRSTKGNNSKLELINSCSIFSLKTTLSNDVVRDKQFDLNMYSLAEAIIMVTPTMYQNDAVSMRTALAMVKDVNAIIKLLVDGGQTIKAGRVIGAFRNIGREDFAEEIKNTMKRLGFEIREIDLLRL